jgi:hypothetical protein
MALFYRKTPMLAAGCAAAFSLRPLIDSSSSLLIGVD